MLKLKKLTSLNLIWIENHGYWTYQCQTCQKVKVRKEASMLAVLLFAGLVFFSLLALIYLLSLSPFNTICPKCKQKKKFREHGWKSLCQKCERRLN